MDPERSRRMQTPVNHDTSTPLSVRLKLIVDPIHNEPSKVENLWIRRNFVKKGLNKTKNRVVLIH
jgi:hypothetical protein